MKTIILLILASAFVSALYSQAGTLDRSFGDTGLVIGNYLAVENKIAQQKDGKIVAAGTLTQTDGSVIARYNTDGSPDSSFGKNGVVTTGDSTGIDYCYDVEIQKDGKIVTTGSISEYPYNRIGAARYNMDGTIDKSFGINGLIKYVIGEKTNVAVSASALQEDGKILIMGLSYTNENDYGDASFIVRLTADGRVDESFGNQGVEITKFSESCYVTSIEVTSEGKIVVGGTWNFIFNTKFMVLRYLPDGTPDSSFGNSGMAKETEFSAELYSIALQKDGNIVAGGSDGQYIKLERFTDKGTVDSSFGKNGIVITEFDGYPEIHKVLIQNDQKIIGAGTIRPGWIDAKLVVVRYLPNGDIDPSFGTNGSTVTASNSLLYCTDALLQEDEKIVVAAETVTTGNAFAFARYLNDDAVKQVKYVKIKKWLHHHGITWDDCPKMICGNSLSYYKIERSATGSSFSEIGRIVSNQPQHSFEDPAPLTGTGYYRLAAVSTDGSVVYSNVIVIEAENSAIKLYPNPVKSSLHIEGLSSTTKTKLTIIDFTGNVKAATTVMTDHYDWNIASLKPGNYLLRIETNGGEAISKKFVKE